MGVDTVITRADLGVTARGAALDVLVNEFRVSAASGSSLAVAPAPVRVLVRYDEHGGVSYQGAGIGECASLTSTVAEATRDLWVRVPARVGVGDKWRDSAAVELCRDGIPLTAVLVREYTLVAGDRPDSLATLTISRRSQVSISGVGNLRGEPVEIRARGTGEAMLRWSAASGWLQAAEGESHLVLEAFGGGRTQLVEQQVTFSAGRAVRD